jgi:hypothetical protein
VDSIRTPPRVGATQVVVAIRFIDVSSALPLEDSQQLHPPGEGVANARACDVHDAVGATVGATWMSSENLTDES